MSCQTDLHDATWINTVKILDKMSCTHETTEMPSVILTVEFTAAAVTRG